MIGALPPGAMHPAFATPMGFPGAQMLAPMMHPRFRWSPPADGPNPPLHFVLWARPWMHFRVPDLEETTRVDRPAFPPLEKKFLKNPQKKRERKGKRKKKKSAGKSADRSARTRITQIKMCRGDNFVSVWLFSTRSSRSVRWFRQLRLVCRLIYQFWVFFFFLLRKKDDRYVFVRDGKYGSVPGTRSTCFFSTLLA